MVAQRLYTAEELAKIFKIDPEAVHDHLVKNNIPFIMVGKNYLMSEWDLKKKKRTVKGKKRDEG